MSHIVADFWYTREVIFVAAFLGELLILFLLARALTMRLSLTLYRFGFSERWVMHFLAFLFLPGTFIHEVSHYLFSVVLRVRVYGMTLIPRSAAGGYIKMGSMEHAKCDLFRSLMIGSAPFIIGSLLLWVILSFSLVHPVGINWITLLTGLVVFEIGNTMFSSKQDMEGSAQVLLIVAAILVVAYFLGWRISLDQLNQSIPGSFVSVIKQADFFLLIPVCLDILIIGGMLLLGRGGEN